MKKFLFKIRNILWPFLMWLANLANYQNARQLSRIKNYLFRLAGIQIYGSPIIAHGFKCIYPTNIKIEDMVALGHDNCIWAYDKVTIGKYTHTAREVLFIPGSHDISSFEPVQNQQIIIGQGCWIGARATILGGVTIGKGCVIGAGSLVNKNIPDWSVAVGVPAKVIKKRMPAKKITSPFGQYSVNDLKDKTKEC